MQVDSKGGRWFQNDFRVKKSENSRDQYEPSNNWKINSVYLRFSSDFGKPLHSGISI